jgi:predicted NBD/HSP70 family sugar kinase
VPEAASTRHALGHAVAGVLAAIVALADPEQVLIGGSWGPAILDSIRAAVSRLPRQPTVQAAKLTSEPGLTGARADALKRLQTLIATGH